MLDSNQTVYKTTPNSFKTWLPLCGKFDLQYFIFWTFTVNHNPKQHRVGNADSANNNQLCFSVYCIAFVFLCYWWSYKNGLCVCYQYFSQQILQICRYTLYFRLWISIQLEGMSSLENFAWDVSIIWNLISTAKYIWAKLNRLTNSEFYLLCFI